jgi:DNA-binding beta-propeller fold protein YncE
VEATSAGAASCNPRQGELNSSIGDIEFAGIRCSFLAVMFFLGIVSTIAGQSVKWADGVGTVVAFYLPQGVSVSSDGTIYVTDSFNHRIRMIATSGGHEGVNAYFFFNIILWIRLYTAFVDAFIMLFG